MLHIMTDPRWHLPSVTAGRPWNVRLAALVACRDFVRHLSALHSGSTADGTATGEKAKLSQEQSGCVAVFIPGNGRRLGIIPDYWLQLPFGDPLIRLSTLLHDELKPSDLTRRVFFVGVLSNLEEAKVSQVRSAALDALSHVLKVSQQTSRRTFHAQPFTVNAAGVCAGDRLTCASWLTCGEMLGQVKARNCSLNS